MAPLAELISDVTAEIFLRLPPDEPVHLVHASLVCKRWREIITDPGFLRRYRYSYRTPPLLGFFDNFAKRGGGLPLPPPGVRLRPQVRPRQPHGRVLFAQFGVQVELVVWDPITGDRWALPDPGVRPGNHTAAVLCAANGCDHLDCHGGPFGVVLVGSDYHPGSALWAHSYSSEAAAWNASAHLHVIADVWNKPSALVGDDIYLQPLLARMILRYDMERNRLSIVHPPAEHATEEGLILMPTEDGSLGLTAVRGSRLCLWSTAVNPEGIAGWVRSGDVELMTGIPFMPYSSVDLVGSAEGLGIIFVSTEVGLFAVDLKSGRMRKIGDPKDYLAIIPFISFYTPGTIKRNRIASASWGHLRSAMKTRKQKRLYVRR